LANHTKLISGLPSSLSCKDMKMANKVGINAKIAMMHMVGPTKTVGSLVLWYMNSSVEQTKSTVKKRRVTYSCHYAYVPRR
jgi:hypothetical protein